MDYDPPITHESRIVICQTHWGEKGGAHHHSAILYVLWRATVSPVNISLRARTVPYLARLYQVDPAGKQLALAPTLIGSLPDSATI